MPDPHPSYSVIMPVCDPLLDDLKRAVRSFDRQVWPFRELCILDDASKKPEIRAYLGELAARDDVELARVESNLGIAGATNRALELTTGDFSIFLDHDDELAERAMFRIAGLLQEHPEADFIYSDHDLIDGGGRRLQILHKPGWSPELLLSYMYIGHLKVVRTSLAKKVGGFRPGFEGSADHDFALRVTEQTDRIHHISEVLYHWRATRGSMAERSDNKGQAFEAGRRAVEGALERRKIRACAEWPDWARRARLGIYRLRFTSTSEVPVTILIPTRDRVELLRDCIASIEERTEHRNWKILILDNESRDPATLEYLRSTPHRVLRVPGEFNFAAIVNRGVEAADTEHVVLLNNDILVASREWLDELIGYAQIDGVGAVGAKLLYPDGRIQHAGVTLGIHGLTAHAFQGRLDSFSPLEYGYFAHVGRNCAAVTAACILTRRSLFLEAGGLDEQHLPVAWNDTDYCLRLLTRGQRTVMNPYAELIHLESRSRGDEKNDREIRTMFERWSSWIEADPYYNPNLTRLDTGFELRTRLQERSAFHYTPDGFRWNPDGEGAPAPPPSSSELEGIDLEAITRSQEQQIRELTLRLGQLERADRIVQFLASRPLLQRLQRSRWTIGLLRTLRRLKHRPRVAALLRRIGLIA
jgi:GT2 family glycosyltransferase